MRLIAAGLLLVAISFAGLVMWRSPQSYASQDREHIAEGTSSAHKTGTDNLGRDRTVRTAGAMLLGLGGSIAASAVATLLAVCAGVTAAFSARWIGSSVMYLCDLFLTLPWIFLLMTVRAALPLTLSPMHSAELTFLMLGLLGAPVFVRMNYARASVLRNADWLLHGRASGVMPYRLAFRHLLPHLKPLFLSQFLIYIPVCLVAEANLGSLGLGVSQPLPSWGSMLQELQSTSALASSHWIYLPIVLLVAVLLLLEMMMFEVEA